MIERACRIGRRALGLYAMVLVIALAPRLAGAETVAEFYRGKTITLVDYSSGGGNDVLAHLVAAHIRKFIPGNPTVIVKSIVGAAGLQEANYLYGAAPKDGTVFGTLNRGIAFARLFGATSAQFDPLKFNWIGNTTKDVLLGASWRDSPVKTIADARDSELIVGATAPDGETAQVPMALNATTGTKFKIVYGYSGGNEILIAMERGEIGGRLSWTYESIVATNPDWLREGKVNLLFQSGAARDPRLPQVPLALDYVKGPLERQILELIFSKLEMSRPYTLPPDVPADRVAALRQAFMATMADEEFRAAAAKSQIDISPIDGDQVRAIVAHAVNSPNEVIARVREIVAGR
jgi:tripartite-type tricarboxylate transporter receptor subunit TctC